MKTMQKIFAIATVLLLTACTTYEFKPFSNQLQPLRAGETRLTGIEMPEVVREDLAYDVILSIASEEKPQIGRICFRWVAEEISSSAPSLYCYSMSDNLGAGTPCTIKTTGATTTGSPVFCINPSEVKTDIPGKLIVRIYPTKLQPTYNRLEGQIEYVSDGQTRMTNALRTPIVIH
jgi:hypothetical protein